MDNKIEKIEKLEIESISCDLVSVETYRKACAILMMIKSLIKEIQDTFSPIKSKAHATWKEAVSQENRHLTKLYEAEKTLKDKINEYASREEELSCEGVSYRNDWKFRVVDEELVPREFLIINEPLIRERIKALGPIVQIPGVEIWQEKNVIAARAALTIA